MGSSTPGSGSASRVRNLTFPRVLIVSDTWISKTHGTGKLVMRHFSHYPQHRLAKAYLNSSGEMLLHTIAI
jgi:hypothetical protein